MVETESTEGKKLDDEGGSLVGAKGVEKVVFDERTIGTTIAITMMDNDANIKSSTFWRYLSIVFLGTSFSCGCSFLNQALSNIFNGTLPVISTSPINLQRSVAIV